MARPSGPPSCSASSAKGRRSPLRVDRGFWNQLLYPAEGPLPSAGPLREIRVTYPEAGVDVFGFEMHWMIPFFVLSIVFAPFFAPIVAIVFGARGGAFGRSALGLT